MTSELKFEDAPEFMGPGGGDGTLLQSCPPGPGGEHPAGVQSQPSSQPSLIRLLTHCVCVLRPQALCTSSSCAVRPVISILFWLTSSGPSRLRWALLSLHPDSGQWTITQHLSWCFMSPFGSPLPNRFLSSIVIVHLSVSPDCEVLFPRPCLTG